MKKYIFITIINLISYLPIIVIASPELTMNSVIVEQGKESTLNIKLSGNDKEYAGINTTIIMPSDLIITGISKGKLLAGFSLDYRIFSNDNKATILSFSKNKMFRQSGTLFILNVEAKKNALPGLKTIEFASANNSTIVNSKTALSNTDGSASIHPVLKNGFITISTPDDTDWDGLPDKLEIKIINSNDHDNIKELSDVNPDDDFDGDGASNLNEYQNGTDPTDLFDSPYNKDDHGNDCNTATIVEINSDIQGIINKKGDIDYFKIQIPYEGRLSIYTKSATDTKGILKNTNCLTIAQNDDYEGDLNFTIERQVTEGIYYAAVSHYSSKGTGKYILFITFLQDNENFLCGQGKPSIEIIDYPPLNNRIQDLYGRVCHVDPINCKIAVYIFIDGYFTKPNLLYPLTDINNEGYWRCDVTTAANDYKATLFLVFLIPADYQPPLVEGVKHLPESLYENAITNLEILR